MNPGLAEIQTTPIPSDQERPGDLLQEPGHIASSSAPTCDGVVPALLSSPPHESGFSR